METDPQNDQAGHRLPADPQTQAWQDLKEQLEQLHARLEYTRLMLKLRPAPQPGG